MFRETVNYNEPIFLFNAQMGSDQGNQLILRKKVQKIGHFFALVKIGDKNKNRDKNRGQTTVLMAFKRRVLFKPWSVPYFTHKKLVVVGSKTFFAAISHTEKQLRYNACFKAFFEYCRENDCCFEFTSDE